MQRRPPPSSFPPDLFSFGAIVVGAAGVLASLLFKLPGWILIAGFGLAFLGIALYFQDRFRSELERTASDVIQSARAEEERPEAKLRRELTRLKYEPGKEGAAEALREGLDRLDAAYAEFSRSLASRLDPQEMTFDRFASAAAEVKLAAVRSLAQGAAVVASGAAARAPDRLAGGGSRPSLPGQATAPAGAVETWLGRNDRAVEGLRRMTEALLAMRGTAGDPARDLERALKDLRDLAARAKNY